MMEGRDDKGKFVEGNQISVGNEGGRPALFTDPTLLEEKTLEYFDWCKGEFIIEHKVTSKTTGKGKAQVITTESTPVQIWVRYPEKPSITGLALYLGFESRQSLYDYLEKPEFSYYIKKALLHVENTYEKGLWDGKVVGPVFALKNMGWTDKQEVDQKTDLSIHWNEEKTYE